MRKGLVDISDMIRSHHKKTYQPILLSEVHVRILVPARNIISTGETYLQYYPG